MLGEDHGRRPSITDSPVHQAIILADPVALQKALDAGQGVRTVAIDAWGDLFEPIDLLWSVPHDDSASVIQCIEMLVGAGATTKTRAGAFREIIFHTAPADVISAFLKHTDCNPNESLAWSAVFTPLMSAVSHHTDPIGVSMALLRAGANPNAISTHAQVAHFITPVLPLHEAITRCRKDIVDLLLSAGADPFMPDPRTEMRAVHWARHAVAARDTKHCHEMCALFEALEESRRRFRAVWPELKRELMEAAWHPARLARQGYFEMEML